MANMRMLIRIVFVIFIANEIDCFGSYNCCNFPKDENIIKDENITPESLVNNNWYESKKNNLVLMIFKKEDDNDIFTSTENGDKISFKFDEKDNSKIAYQDETENKLKLNEKKYALFKIKTNENKTVYLYCSDVESSKNNGIFEKTDHKSISVIACDTEKVTDMAYMFYGCSSLKELKFGDNFNTSKVKNKENMFDNCINLPKDTKNKILGKKK